MKLTSYPYRAHVRKVMGNFMNTKDTVDFLKEKGIMIYARKKDDYAKIGADINYSMSDFVKLKEKIDSKENYRNSNRINIPTDQLTDLKEALIEISSGNIGDEEETKVRVVNNPDGTWKFNIEYTEFKPGLIGLLDTIHRDIEVSVNKEAENSSLDFSTQSNHDYKKVNEILTMVHETNSDVEFSFSEIKLSSLSKEKRIQLFNDFFQFDNPSWELKKIMKLKVKRDKEEKKLQQKSDEDKTSQEENDLSIDELEGINSAILDGQNLIENSFVKTTIKSGFYFSMALMRFENKLSDEFIDLSIDFKSRPEKFDTLITNAGTFSYGVNGLTENKVVLDPERQEQIVFLFKNIIYQIFITLLQQENTDIEIEDSQIQVIDPALEESAAGFDTLDNE